jgi:hypothetical protein
MLMMSIENVKKAEQLIRERSHIAAAKWNRVAAPQTNNFGNQVGLIHSEAADEQLQWAIEEFRKRKLDAIDAQLRELGFDPTTEA